MYTSHRFLSMISICSIMFPHIDLYSIMFHLVPHAFLHFPIIVPVCPTKKNHRTDLKAPAFGGDGAICAASPRE
jgi:hypothetical protein